MYRIRSFFTSLSLMTRLAIFAAITMGIALVIIKPLQSYLEGMIAQEYYGQKYLELEKAKRNILRGDSLEKIEKFGAVQLLNWSEEAIEKSWLDSSRTTEEDRAKLILGKRSIEQALPSLLKGSEVLPETKRNELGVLKQAAKILPTEITKQKPKDLEFSALVWGSIGFLSFVWFIFLRILLLPSDRGVEASGNLRAISFLFATLFALLTIWQLDQVIWTNALLVRLS